MTGFPSPNTLSPTVLVAVRDNTFTPTEISTHRAGIVGFASKGVINTPQTCTSKRQLHTYYGYPHPEESSPYLIYAGELYLSVATELVVVRVGVTDEVDADRAETAEAEAMSAGGQIEIVSDVAGPYSFDKDSYFRWRLNGVLSAKSLVVVADASHPDSTVVASGYSALQLAEDLNLQVPDGSIDGIEFFATDDNRIGVRTTFAYGPDASLELVSVRDAIYGGSTVDDPNSSVNVNVTGLGQGMEVAQYTGSADRYPNDAYTVAGNYDFAGVATQTLKVVVDGTDDESIDNVVQVISFAFTGEKAITDIVDEINQQITDGDIPGGFEAVAVGSNLSLRTLHHGADARLLVKSDSALFNFFGFEAPHSDPSDDGSATTTHATAYGVTPAGVSGDANIQQLGIVVGDSNTTGDVSFTITADSPGIEGNLTQVQVVNNIREGSFNINVFNNGTQVEAWGPLTKDESSVYYVESYIARNSNYIQVVDNTANTAPPANGTYSLAGGTDGIPADADAQDALLIGSDVAYTGIYTLSDTEVFQIDLVAAPGHTSTSVISALIDLAETRGDCLAIIDPPFGFTPTEITQWQNGVHPFNSVRFDSDHAAIFWPWVKYTDTYNRIDVWIPPSGAVMAMIARSDNIGAEWMAPAGVIRGVVPGISGVYSRPTREERNLMYGYGNAINPIALMPGSDDFVCWGQKTLQRRPTRLNRINVSRLRFAVKRRIERFCQTLLFDPNDEQFAAKFYDGCANILREIQVGRGITDWIIDIGPDVNTDDSRDRLEFRAKIGIVPTLAVEYIFIELSLNRNSGFTETVDLNV